MAATTWLGAQIKEEWKTNFTYDSSLYLIFSKVRQQLYNDNCKTTEARSKVKICVPDL